MANARQCPSNNAAASRPIRIWKMTQLERFLVDESIIVKGKVAAKAKSFAISLGQDASNLYICFKPDLANGIIKCHYKKDGKCGPERTCLSCPFHEGQEVQITFFLEGRDNNTIVTVELPDHTQFRFSSPVRRHVNKYVAVDGDFQQYPDRTQ
ncbi:galectin-1-like isoform X1 [Eublepharis macularius]|uniref:Galectin n=2 Tax=Eublepharis macularius TaxID=481883 RepID=A0AA97J4G4_EUBMA|nr:galectin-1-like isoform X1 [Eublepharis macularius]XP_054830796.1 galectin-1-like isoform X1 [Eublepharis macularius]